MLTITLTVAGYLLTLFLIPLVILRRRDPVAATAWILAIVMMPYFGGLLYLAFGTTQIRMRTERKRRSRETLAEHLEAMPRPAGGAQEPEPSASGVGAELMPLAARVAGTRAVPGNDVEVVTDTNRAYGLQIQAIRDASRHVHVEYYIFQPDRTGRAFRDVLVERAREGVKVRFLYDAVGSLKLGARFLRPLRAAGAEVAAFQPVNPLKRRFIVNLRNHRKILIADGRVGFTGGVNVGDEYRGRKSQFGYWRDTHVVVRGPAVPQLQRIFAEDWIYATGSKLVDPDLYPRLEPAGRYTVGVYGSGPDRPVPVAHELILAAISAARSELLMETSYFVPPESLSMALRVAAHRGVRVRLVVPMTGAHLTARSAARSYYEELMSAGVEIYEYSAGMLHAKVMVVDGEWGTVGSTNLDNRSLKLNFEAGVILYGREEVKGLSAAFAQDLERSVRVDPGEWAQRSLLRRLAQDTCRLLSPVL